MKLWHWLLLGGGAAVVGWVVLYRHGCLHCQQLAKCGEFDQIASDFDEVCSECVDVGIANSMGVLEAKMTACEKDPNPRCEEELVRYWNNLFLVARKANQQGKLGDFLLSARAAEDPTLVRYDASRYNPERGQI